MPKECAHWILAERFRVRRGSSRVSSLLRRHRHVYLLGSVLPDSTFYRVFGRLRPAYRAAGDRMHGSRGEDTLDFLRALVEGWGGPLPDSVQALALGAACHVMVDSAFHPMVFHLCGSEEQHDPALARHFLFETYLDLHYLGQAVAPGGGRLRSLIQVAEIARKRLLRAVRLIYFGHEWYPERTAATTLNQHADIQMSFRSRPLRAILQSVQPIMAERYRGTAALYYPPHKGPVPFFERPIRYSNPVLGDQCEEALDAIEDRAMARLEPVFSAFESGPPTVETVAGLVGPSALTGLPPGSETAMRHFHTEPLEQLLFPPGTR